MFEYKEYNQTLRIDRALELVSRCQANDNFIEVNVKMTTARDANIQSINRILLDRPLSPDALAKVYKAEVIELIKREGFGPILQQLFNFNEQALMCQEKELCEEEVLCNFLDNDAGSYTRTFYPYICELRETWNNPEVHARVTKRYTANTEVKCQ